VETQLEWRTADEVFAAKVGRTAARVWLALLKVRDATLVTHITLTGIRRIAGGSLTEPQVRRALARLNDLGMVINHGWKHTEVPYGRAQATDVHEVFERTVVGAADGQAIGLPLVVWQKVEAARTWGGARERAGRPRKSNPTPSRMLCETPIKQAEKIKAYARVVHKEKESNDTVLFSSRKEPAASGGFSSFFESAEREVVMDGLPVVSDEHGSLLGGGGIPAAWSADEWLELPPFPGVAVVPPARIPAPPMVAADSSPEARLKMLLAAYDTTLKRKLPQEFNPVRKHGPRAADKKLLLAAAEALHAHDVSPMRWVEFSFDQYAIGREADKAAGKRERAARPPLQVVFAVKRIEETAGWCRSTYDDRGATLVLTRSLKSLIARYQQMRTAVQVGKLSPAAAVAQHFPNGLYDRMVAAAAKDARREQELIDTHIANGEYLW